jgi:hypothetical protein
MKSLAIDLYCGLGGWAEGFLAEGYNVVGFDTVRHDYGTGGYPGWLVLQDVLTLHGSQFKDAAVIVASPPCQAYSYRAMPWRRAKDLPPPDNTLFEACFRIQREACEAAGRHIPLIVENVRGAQKWVGRAAWNFGSYYLWGDVPALMPIARVFKNGGWGGGSWFIQTTGAVERHNPDGRKVPGIKLSEVGFNVAAAQRYREGVKHGGSWFNIGSPGQKVTGQNPDGRPLKTVGHINQRESDAVKQHGSGPVWFDTGIAKHSSRSDSRKAASAMIAKIPFPLAQHIAKCFKPAR